MASPPRIIAADQSPQVPNIVRAALDLLKRRAVVIDVPSGEAALEELARGDVHLLVCASALPDMRGSGLATRVHELAPGIPVIILAGADAEEDVETQSPLHYLIRAEQGDRFVRVLRATLDGEVFEDAPAPSPASGQNLGPVPEIPIDDIAEILGNVLTDVGAMAVVLADRTGSILLELGAVGYLDREQLTGTLAPNFSNMVSVGPLVGGAQPRAMHFYDGDEFDIFGLAVGLHHFVCLIFEGSAGSRAFGAVTMFGRRAIQEILELIGDAAFQIQKPEPAAAVVPPAQPPSSDAAAPVEEARPEPEEAPAHPPLLEPLPDDADLESVLDGLDKLDLSQADELFDPDKLAEIAAESLAGERLTYEEAQQMGVLQR